MATCLPCFSPSHNGDDDRQPLLQDEPEFQPPPSAPSRQPLNKFADILSALRSGKLPSQTQINQLLQRVLRLELLQSTRDPESAATPEVLRGDGPLSTSGRKVIQGFEEVIQVVLQFGMEKNVDDLIQDMLFQIAQIDLEESSVSLDSHSETADRGKVSEAVDGSSKNTKEPRKSEAAADAKVMSNALKSLCLTLFTSSIFRFILLDAISIGRDLLAHAASDVSHVAIRVRDFAENIEEQAVNADLSIDRDPQEPISLQQVVGELVEAGQGTTNAAVRGVQETMAEEKREWKEHVAETEEEAKRRLLVRIQGVVVRAQEDPSSREAILAILQIIRKYAHKFVLISHETVTSIREADGEACSSSKKGEDTSSQQEIPMTYPPRPHPVETVPVTLIPGIEINSLHLQRALQDLKLMIERLASGYNIEGIMNTLGDLVKHITEAPRGVRETVEKFAYETLQQNEKDLGAAQHDQQAGVFGEPSRSSIEGRSGEDTRNVFAKYFSNVGTYLDKALNEPGWATSENGQKALDALYGATQDLLHIADDIIADTKDVVQEKLGEVQEKLEEVQEGQENERSDKVSIEKTAEGGHKPTTRWVDDAEQLFDQIGDYIDAVQQDRTTMRLVRALETLRNDTEELLIVGREQMDKAAREVKSWTQKCGSSLGRLGLYVRWAAWLVPQLIHLLPLEIIPVPRVEFKTGKVEGAFDALWVRGTALKNEAVGGRYGSMSRPQGTIAGNSQQQGEAVLQESGAQNRGEGGIGGKLVPDEILVRQWNEMRVTLAEGRGAAAIGADSARLRMGMMGGTKRRNTPGIEVVSRLKVRMEGIKVCLREMGYYFRYNGSVFSYEDEGVLNVDLGTATGGGRNSGFGLNVELEVDSSDVEMNLLNAKTTTTIPALVVEDMDATAGVQSYGSPNTLQNQSTGEFVNITNTDRGANALSVDRSRTPIELALPNVTPLFRVIGVHADLRGIKFRMDRSRHYILNKLFVEPFGGIIVGDIVKSVLEERIHKALEAASRCLALVLTEAKERAFNRQTKITTKGKRGRPTPEEVEGDGEMRMSDVFDVLVERGPDILAYYAGDSDPQDRYIHTQREMTLDATGVVYSRRTRVRFQEPLATRSAIISPISSINNEDAGGDVRMSREGERTENTSSGEETNSVVEDEEEMSVALGIGPQLFPERGGLYHATKGTETTQPGLTEGMGEPWQRNQSATGSGKQKIGGEGGGTWRSLVFDW